MARSIPTEARARFAKRLKTIRVPRGFRTARSFAEALGIDENRYTRYERGEVEPSLDLILRICELLSATPNDLLCDYIGAQPSPLGYSGFADHADNEPLRARRLAVPGQRSTANEPYQGPEREAGDERSARIDALAWLLASELVPLQFSPATGSPITLPYKKLQLTAENFARLKAEPFAVLSTIAETLERGGAGIETQARILELVDSFATALSSAE
ncbi:MAG: helix-turn-helix transcriptional regulator [Hyphomicrobiaceae bacterium]|nr:helix-turn-helix transcriptional regulator [Hyphomicrobiaceae bacterium]